MWRSIYGYITTAYIPPVGEIGSPMGNGPPRWRKVQEVVQSVIYILKERNAM